MKTETRRTCSTLSWEILILVGHHLDPKTLAIASCVSKSWLHSMSSDLLWKPILTTHFPSLSTLPSAVSYRRRYKLGHTAATRRIQSPSKPTLTLNDIVFSVSLTSLTSKGDTCVIAVASRLVDTLVANPVGVFRFDFGFDDGVSKNKGWEEVVKVTWNVVVKGWGGFFTMMEREKKVGFVGGSEEWFSEELPSPGCCCSKVAANSVVAADVKVGMWGLIDGKVRVEKVSLGILSVADWRYVGVDDGLRYLQHFLLD